MNRFIALAGFALALTACGPRAPGPHPDELIYWRITSSDVQFSNCSDDPDFRSQVQPVQFDPGNTYLIYKVAKDNKSAVGQDCTSFDRSSCTDTDITFEVVDHQLLFTKETKSPLNTNNPTGCQLDAIQNWTLTDNGQDMDVEITNTLTEVDNPADCAADEANIQSNSPNGLGLNGCVVTFTLGATIRPQSSTTK